MQNNKNAKPLASFMLLAYNQERYIREAVQGALSQTYSPLEIILSDDCSTDRTFEIMQEMASFYEGPHEIILNRNERNIGICSHVNKLVSLCNGELIICAAGDDISLPHRTERLVDEWIKSGKKAHSICSNAIIIDENSKEIEKYIEKDTEHIVDLETACNRGIVGISGCTHSFSKKNFEVFGPINPLGLGEDDWIGFRSVILGHYKWIPDVLVKYRRHDKNTYVGKKKIKKDVYKAYEYACKLGLYENCKSLKIAYDLCLIDKGNYENAKRKIEYAWPMVQYCVVETHATAIYSFICILKRIINGTYRKGMISVFEDTYIPENIRNIIRTIRFKNKENKLGKTA